MLSLPPSVRIFLCMEPADMRRSFDSLAAMTVEIIGEDPLSGHLFVFRNRRGDRLILSDRERVAGGGFVGEGPAKPIPSEMHRQAVRTRAAELLSGPARVPHAIRHSG